MQDSSYKENLVIFRKNWKIKKYIINISEACTYPHCLKVVLSISETDFRHHSLKFKNTIIPNVQRNHCERWLII